MNSFLSTGTQHAETVVVPSRHAGSSRFGAHLRGRASGRLPISWAGAKRVGARVLGARAWAVVALLAGVVVAAPGVTPGVAEAQAQATVPGLDLVMRDSVSDNDFTYLQGANDVEVFTQDGKTLAVVSSTDESIHLLDISDPDNINELRHPNRQQQSGDNNFNNAIGGESVETYVGADGRYYVVLTWATTDAIQTFHVAENGRLDEIAHVVNGSTMDLATNAFVYAVEGKQYAAVIGSLSSSLQIVDLSTGNVSGGLGTGSLRGALRADTEVDGVEVASHLSGPAGVTHYYNVDAKKHYAVVVTDDSDAIALFDVTNPEPTDDTNDTDNIVVSGFLRDNGDLELNGSEDVDVYSVGSRTFAVVTGNTDDGIQIVDITIPANPRAAGQVEDNGGDLLLDNPRGVSVHTIGDRHYAAVASSGDHALSVVDVTDPYNPAVAAAVSTDGTNGTLYTATGVDTYSMGNRHFAIVASNNANDVQIVEMIPRYNDTASADGSLDTTFGTDGVVAFDDGAFEDVFAVGIQADNKIVTAGSRLSDGDSAVLLTRRNPDGTIDPTFGDGGKVLTEIVSGGSGNGDRAFDLLIQPDQKILIVGGHDTGGTERVDIAVARYNPDGSLDSDFKGGGKFKFKPTDAGFGFAGDDDFGFSVALRPDNKIIIAGESGDKFVVVRLHANGEFDEDEVCSDESGLFQDVGRVITTVNRPPNPPSGHARATSMALQPDGKVVMAGFRSGTISTRDFLPIPIANTNQSALLYRLHPNCQLDRSFNGSGFVIQNAILPETTVSEISRPYFVGVEVQPDGKIVAAMRTSPNRFTNSYGLVRYNSDGTADTTFGNAGRDRGFVDTGSLLVEDLALLPDGKIIVAGHINDRFSLQRYHPDGTLDTSFGLAGTATTEIVPGEKISKIRDIAVAPDGSIVAAGYSGTQFVDSRRDAAIARFHNTLYQVDVWKAELTLQAQTGGSSGCNDSAATAALQCSNPSVLSDATFTFDDVDYAVRVVDFSSTVSLDLDKDFPPSFGRLVLAVDKIETPLSAGDLAARSIFPPNSFSFPVVELKPPDGGTVRLRLFFEGDWAGELDPSFGAGGSVSPTVAGQEAQANAAAVQADGKTVLVGRVHDGTSRDFAVTRLNVDGTLDTTFGDGGRGHDRLRHRQRRGPCRGDRLEEPHRRRRVRARRQRGLRRRPLPAVGRTRHDF